MAGKRRAFTNEFKAEAVRLVTVDGHPVSQVAKDLGIHDSLLRRWQRKLDARRVREVGMKPALAVASSVIVEQDEIRRYFGAWRREGQESPCFLVLIRRRGRSPGVQGRAFG